MVAKATFYGAVALVFALIVVGGTASLFFYYQYTGERSTNEGLVSELGHANQNYSRLATNFNSLLSRYNESLSLLSRSIAVLNTSAPVYMDASKALGSLWQEYLALKPSPTHLFHADILIEFGNGSKVWFNSTAVQPGWNAYIATVVLLNGGVDATWYPQFGEHFVTGLGGVSSQQTNSWFVWNHGNGGWEVLPTGADQLQVYDGTVFAWTLCRYDQGFNPTCRP